MNISNKKFKQKSQLVKVILRSRPLLEFENEPAWQIKSSSVIQCMHTKSVHQKLDKASTRSQTEIQSKLNELVFNYEKIYQDKATSEKIYKLEARSMIQQCLSNNENLTLMCYGQTCSGKTFTVLGQQKQPGLMPCLLRDLIIYKKQLKNNCQIKISYFQIYNQSIFDLLVNGNKKNNNIKYKLYGEKKFGCQVNGLKIQSVQNFQDCIKIIEKGEKNRSYASKQNHQRSSRSHTIMKIQIQKQDQSYNKHRQIFNIVDLAGSQRLSQYSKNPRQTALINKSLFQLSNVISKLSLNNPHSHIPYRDSKLTKILQCSLNGDSRCLIIFCISLAVQSFHETVNTLRLAKKAKNIQIEITENLTSNWSPIQIQLFETKQKLYQKTSQCEQLAFRLDYLTKQLEKLENYVQKIPKKSAVNVDLLLLLDHKNFILKNLQSNQIINSADLSKVCQNKSFQNELQTYQIEFKHLLQELYEQYIFEIINIYLNNLLINKKQLHPDQQFLLKIEQICFKDIIFDQNIRNQCRLFSIQKLIEQLQNNQEKENNHTQINVFNNNFNKKSNFIHLIKLYQKNLTTKSKSSREKSLNLDNSEFSLLLNDKNNIKSSSNQLQNQQQTEYVVTSVQKQLQCTTVYAWGCPKDGRVFKGLQIIPGITKFIKQQMGKINKIKTAYNHSLLLTSNGKAYGWGKNNFNQISPKDSAFYSLPREIDIKQKVKSVATGWGHSLALTQNGKAYSWGYGQNGQLGHGQRQNTFKPKLIEFQSIGLQVYAGHSHSAILDRAGQLYTFGFNKDYRCLVKSDSLYLVKPTKVPLNKIKQATLGVSHSIVLTQDNYAFGGGIGSNGEFGQELTLDTKNCEYIEVQSRKFQDDDQRYEKVCPLIELKFQSKQNEQIIKVKCGENKTYFLTNLRNLYFCGENFNKKLSQRVFTPKLLLSNINQFSVGSRHGFAFQFKTNKIFGWGFNMYNQLGNNEQKDMISPEVISGLSALNLVNIQCGFIHTISLGI